MRYQNINAYFNTIEWCKENIIDWTSAGQFKSLNGDEGQLGQYHYSHFNAAVTSEDGVYAFIYNRLATKGLLLKSGELIREINRSYYCADTYEYPAAFITVQGKTYLAHCPKKYCQLDFEDVETGEIITDIKDRKPSDFFHSVMSVSPDGKYLLVRGWAWHPVESFSVFSIEDCLKNPLLLDDMAFFYNFGMEINSASFIDNEYILVASSDEEPFDDENPAGLPPKHITLWNFKTNKLSIPIKAPKDTGNFFAINHQLAWDMYKYPKLINIETGQIIDTIEDINSGLQNSCIYTSVDKCPQIKFNKSTGQIAVLTAEGRINVLSV